MHNGCEKMTLIISTTIIIVATIATTADTIPKYAKYDTSKMADYRVTREKEGLFERSYVSTNTRKDDTATFPGVKLDIRGSKKNILEKKIGHFDKISDSGNWKINQYTSERRSTINFQDTKSSQREISLKHRKWKRFTRLFRGKNPNEWYSFVLLHKNNRHNEFKRLLKNTWQYPEMEKKSLGLKFLYFVPTLKRNKTTKLISQINKVAYFSDNIGFSNLKSKYILTVVNNNNDTTSFHRIDTIPNETKAENRLWEDQPERGVVEKYDPEEEASVIRRSTRNLLSVDDTIFEESAQTHKSGELKSDELNNDEWGEEIEEKDFENGDGYNEDIMNHWSLEDYVALVDAIADYFYAPCVFLIYDPASVRESGTVVALWRTFSAVSNRMVMSFPWMEALRTPSRKAPVHSRLPPPLRLPRCRGRPLAVITSTTTARALTRSQRRWPGEARWLLLLLPLASAERLLRALQGVRLPPDCEVLVPRAAPHEGVVLLEEALRPWPRAPLQLRRWGEWARAGRVRGPAAPLAERRSDLHGATLTAAVSTCFPLERVVQTEGGHEQVLQGLFPKVWSIVVRSLNATERLAPFKDCNYGSEVNGSWNGLIGAVRSGRVDIAINSFLMSGSRMSAIDFTVPVVLASAGVFVRESSDSPLRWELMASPFSAALWLCVGAALAVAGGALSLISLVPSAPPDAVRPHSALSPSDALIFVLSAICNQGSEQWRGLQAGRMVAWVLHVLAVVVLAAYSANLIASLALRRVGLPFEDLKGLVEHGGYAFGVVAGMLKNFIEAKDPLLLRVYSQLLSPTMDNQPKSFTDGFERVCKGRYAFMTGTHTVSRDGPLCPMAVLPRGGFPLALAMVLPHGSPFKRIINARLESMRLSGAMRRLFLRDWPRLQPRSAAPRFFPVALLSVVPVLVALGAALALALLVLLLLERRGARPRCRLPRRRTLLDRRRQRAPASWDEYVLRGRGAKTHKPLPPPYDLWI